MILSMLFNSFEFIFVFLPSVLLGCLLFSAFKSSSAKIWIIFSSLFFYSWWNAFHILIILSVMLFTFTVGQSMLRVSDSRLRKALLVLGLSVDIAVLGYFKYFIFFAESINSFVGTSFRLDPILLPLALSFFTFQKIAFLMDIYQGKVRKCLFVDYCLFVTFFPQLIAGPIVHYRELAPQFMRDSALRLRISNFSVGLSMFIMGLFKKVIIADSLAPLANMLFQQAVDGRVPSLADSWVGVLAYSLQLYFDFSGYSDMAIGLSRIFGIQLPQNFNSPYKSTSIVEFWRRWHITLSNFLRDYIYIPLGGSRCGKIRVFVNLVLTMLIGGLWHGAGWTFVLWGLLHGVFLAVNHAWQKSPISNWGGRWSVFPAWALTFICIAVAWVFFRASSIADAGRILSGMFLTKKTALKLFEADDAVLVIGCLFAALIFPNTQQIFGAFRPCLGWARKKYPDTTAWMWKPRVGWAFLLAVMFAFCICCMMRPSQFLYFQF